MTVPAGTISYAAAAVAFLFLFALLVLSWRGRIHGAVLALACLTSATWAALMALQAWNRDSALLSAEVLEPLHKSVWIAFLIMLIGNEGGAAARSPRMQRVAAGLLGFCALLVCATAVSGLLRHHEFLMPGFTTGIIGGGVMAVIGMVLVEHLYRNADPRRRWTIKYLCLGLGGLFAYDFYLYADAMLFRRLDHDFWVARGIISTFVVPLVAVTAARNPTWSLDIAVSRRVVFHSTALLGAGLYLLVMAVAGYYVKFVGVSWGGILQTTFLFGALLLLLLIIFSGTLRARLRTFLSKHFFSYRYDYREEWLRFTRTLSEGEPGIRLHERSLEAIAGLVESPAGALWMRQESGTYERVAHWNLPSASGIEEAGSALCEFLGQRQWVISVQEAEINPEAYGDLKLPAWLCAIPRVWLVVPLILHERLLGFVVLTRSLARVTLNWEVSDLLKTAGRQAASYLAQLQAAQALLQARQFESFNRMSAFVVHDLKNLIAQLSLLLSNAERHKHNPAFQQDMFSTIEHSVQKMNRLLMQLRSGGLPVEKPVPIALDRVLGQAVESKSSYRPAPALQIVNVGLSVTANPERLERVFGHLIQNAIEATPADGSVVVRVTQQADAAVIEVSDNGRGMSEDFIRSALFKPFESTKATGMGIGTYESREYVRELGGRMEVISGESRGTTFRVTLPLVASDESADAPISRRTTG